MEQKGLQNIIKTDIKYNNSLDNEDIYKKYKRRLFWFSY